MNRAEKLGLTIILFVIYGMLTDIVNYHWPTQVFLAIVYGVGLVLFYGKETQDG